MILRGQMKFEQLESGFWTFLDESGVVYRPLNTPAALQVTGLKVTIKVKPADAKISVFMRGKPVIIEHFELR